MPNYCLTWMSPIFQMSFEKPTPHNMAAKQSIVQVRDIIDPNQTDPEKVITPGIFVNKIIEITNPIIESNAIEKGLIYP